MTRKQVLLWGMSGDPQLDGVRDELKRCDEPHFFLDQRDYASARVAIEIGNGLEGLLEFAERRLDIRDIGAVFARPLDGREVALLLRDDSLGTDVDALEWESQVVALERKLFAWIDIADSLVVNTPSAMASNSSKPRQCEFIRKCGFSIPDTLVTTSPADAREFIARHEFVICKSTSGHMSLTSLVDTSDLACIDDIRHCPTQFQARVAGIDWRAHVIGDRVFACEVRCAADDYRIVSETSEALQIRSAILPPQIEERCIAVTNDLGLRVSGIDLRRTPDDEWFCFEVNGAPSFNYFERAAGQPLSRSVADLLLAGAQGRPS